MLFVWLGLFLVFVSFGLIVLVGAPYVPTKNKDLEKLFKDLKLQKGSLIVDLGSGDGRVLVSAAQAGYRAAGYELNPLLYLTSWVRARKYHKKITVYLKNLWKADVSKADLVFIFTAGRFVKNLEKKFSKELKPGTIVVSYGFNLNNKKVNRKIGPMFVYQF